MGPTFFENRVGDALHLGEQLERDRVVIHTVVTSPPYFGLRDYGGRSRHPAEIGHEDDHDVYVERLVNTFYALPVWDRGSIWVNIGDVRNADGGLGRVPDRLADGMERRGWITADRVAWIKGTVDEDGTVWAIRMPRASAGG